MTTLPDAATSRLARLPDPIRAALLTAMATTQKGDRQAWALEREHWRLALEPVGFVAASGQLVQREIPLAATLTNTQRLVAEALAFVPGMPLERWSLYRATWLARRWLGLEPGGVLFSEVDVELDGARHRWPLLHALRTLTRRGALHVEAFLKTLPWSTKVAALALVHGLSDDVDIIDLTSAVEATIRECLSPPGPVDVASIAAVADEILARAAGPFIPSEQSRGGPNDRAAMMLLGALVAGGATLEPRHDALLRLGFGIFEPVTRRSIAAIPSERCDAALVGALSRLLYDSDRVRLGALFLDAYPLPGFIDAVVDAAGRSDAPPKAFAALAPIAAKHPAVATRLEAERARLGALPTWCVLERQDPIPADGAGLSAVHRRQLEILELRYAGRAVGADEILARRGDGNDDEGILPAHTARLVIADDAGAARFDAWLTMGDSGAVFDLGTEKVVAEIIQGGVESRDRLLRLSLPGVLAFKAPKATSTKKKAAGDTKKAATTKKATSSTKKPVTTKQAATTKKKAAATTKKKAATKKS